MQVSKKQFEKWVGEAVDRVPEKFKDKINNLAFFVEDYPTSDQLGKVGFSPRGNIVLFGLYEGYHQSKRLDVGPVFPDRITLFQKPIESYCRTHEEIKSQIEKTVFHEIAHHFGSDEPGAEKASQGKK